MRRVLPFLAPYRGRVFWALTCLVVAALGTLALPVGVRRVIDFGFSSADTSSINAHFLMLFGIAVLVAVFSALRHYAVSWLGERVVADIRDAVYRRVVAMDPGFFEITRIGEVLSRLTADTTLIQSVVGSSVSIALRSACVFLGGLIMLIITSPKLTTLILLLLGLVVIPLLGMGRRVRALSRSSQDRVADASALASESLSAVQTIQTFNLEETFSRRFGEAVERAFRVARRRFLVRSVLTASAVVGVFGGAVFVLWVGARAVIEGHMSAGELGQFAIYAALIAGTTAALSEVWGEVQRAAGATERLMELLHAEPQIKPPTDPVSIPKSVRGDLRFERVFFHYPSRPHSWALEDYTLEVSAGETVALVGPSGAGKSTVLQLLLRFYDVQRGRIALDGIELATVQAAEVRDRIGVVPQDPVIFAASAMENIRFGRPGASDAEVRAAAKKAQAHEFLERLPHGYQSSLGERGTRLSAGQRQRIAIARALLKNGPVLLLDEATSALDSQSEHLVQEAVAELTQGRTTLVVAHRLATVVRAHRIVVMDKGRVVDTGRHEELVRRGGLYARLAALQFDQRPPQLLNGAKIISNWAGYKSSSSECERIEEP
ncbi:MAG: ABC transporter transmembrane domain-containing protein [Gammaproteobacteria bacterium]